MAALIETKPAALSSHTGLLRRCFAVLDQLYLVAGYLAGASMVVILIITMVQIIGRWFGVQFYGASDYAGYFMAASVFLAMAHTFNRGIHVRIELGLAALGRFRRFGEYASFLASTAICWWFAYYCWDMVYWSSQLGDISQGMDATPLWIPQLSMAMGMSLLGLCVADHGLRLVLTGHHGVPQGPDSV
jgi:TRAP-type C4-dicarboxylate transport system permease small subunit